jgi:fructose-bisphosphate aldolase class 1
LRLENCQTSLFIKILIPSNQPPCLFTLQFESIGVPNEESNRRDLREMLFTSPDIEKYISGVVSTLQSLPLNEQIIISYSARCLLSLSPLLPVRLQ